MKSIYLRNFVATAILVTVCFLIISVAFVGIGRQYLISEYQDQMDTCAEEVSRVAAAVSRGMLTDQEAARTRARTRQLEAEAAAKKAAAEAERERLRAEIDAIDDQLMMADADD